MADEDLYKSSYDHVRIEGIEPHDRAPNGSALVLTQPDNSRSLYRFEIRGIDEDEEQQWVLEWEGGKQKDTNLSIGRWGLASPEKNTLARYEFRLRPYRHWVTFEGVSTHRDKMSNVDVTTQNVPSDEHRKAEAVDEGRSETVEQNADPINRQPSPVASSETADTQKPGDDQQIQLAAVKRLSSQESNKTAADRYAGHYRGLVTGPDGRPFSGAEIFIVSKKGAATDIRPVRTTTDANGRFRFDAPDLTYSGYDGLPWRREGLIFATAEGFAPDWMETWGNNTSRLREYWTPVKGAEIKLQLAVDDVPIKGQFLDAAGRPLVGARVQLDRLMVPRNADLTAHLAHWSKASVAAGFLTKVPDYKRELGRTHLIPGLTVETVTDANGRFTFKGLGRDRLARLKVSATNVLDTNVQVMARDSDNVGLFLDFDQKPTQTVYGADFTLQLKRGLAVKGIVRDRDSKQPIAGMWVTKVYNPLTHPALCEGVPVTDENGRFEFTGLDPAMLTLEEKHRRFTAIPQPGVTYLQARAAIKADAADPSQDAGSAVNANVVIECVRGISYRLKLVDEDGHLVEGTVECRTVSPNPLSADLVVPLMAGTNWPVMNRAARQADGTYEGFVLPGPGAIMVEMPNRRAWRPAFVDPKTFFASATTEENKEAENSYGTRDTLRTFGGLKDQKRSNAIILVNPPAGSESLELTATVYRDRPRLVSLVDPEGRPVVDVESRMQWPNRETKEQLRSATFSITGLHPNRVKQMSFIKEDCRLIAILLARGDGDTPHTVQMQPWCTVTGRVVDENEKPLAGKWISI